MAVARRADTEKAVSELIRKELGTRANARFLARIPAFAAEADVPDAFDALLSRLEEAETSGKRSN